MKNILLLMVIALPLLLISCSDDKDEPKNSDKNEYVDLGLPSGTLWATRNVGANKPEEYGDYFAWGETEPKEVYLWTTYKWCQGEWYTLTKYCTDSKLGSFDNKAELEPNDDAAYKNWGPSWRIPSFEQLEELRATCTWKWTTRNGVNGILLTGPNGNTLFFPAAGSRLSSSLSDAGSDGYYWSRTLYDGFSNYAFGKDFSKHGKDWGFKRYERYHGHSIRAVRVSQN